MIRWVATLLLAAAMMADIVTTMASLHRGNTEMAPLAQWLTFPQLISLKVIVVIAAATVLVVFPRMKRLAWVIVWMSLLTFAVSAWNWIQ